MALCKECDKKLGLFDPSTGRICHSCYVIKQMPQPKEAKAQKRDGTSKRHTTTQCDPVPDLLAQGRSCVESGDYDQATVLANRARQIAPKRPGPILLLARIAGLIEGPEKQIDVLVRFMGTVGNDIPLRRQLAHALLRTRQFKAARAEVEHIVAIEAEDYANYVLLGRCSLAEEDYDQAERFANLAKELAPDRPDPILLLARIAGERSGPEAKAKALRRYLDNVPDLFPVRLKLASVYINLGKPNEAVGKRCVQPMVSLYSVM